VDLFSNVVVVVRMLLLRGVQQGRYCEISAAEHYDDFMLGVSTSKFIFGQNVVEKMMV